MQKTPDPPTPGASSRALLYAALLTTTALRTSLPTPGSTLSSKSRPILLKISDSISSFGLDSTRSEMFTYCAHAHPRASATSQSLCVNNNVAVYVPPSFLPLQLGYQASCDAGGGPKDETLTWISLVPVTELMTRGLQRTSIG